MDFIVQLVLIYEKIVPKNKELEFWMGIWMKIVDMDFNVLVSCSVDLSGKVGDLDDDPTHYSQNGDSAHKKSDSV